MKVSIKQKVINTINDEIWKYDEHYKIFASYNDQISSLNLKFEDCSNLEVINPGDIESFSMIIFDGSEYVFSMYYIYEIHTRSNEVDYTDKKVIVIPKELLKSDNLTEIMSEYNKNKFMYLKFHSNDFNFRDQVKKMIL